MVHSEISDKEVRLRLAQKDAELITRGQHRIIHNEMSPSVLIYQGLEIEDLQYVLNT